LGFVLDVGCGNAGLAKGDVNVDFFREGRNVQVGEQLVGEVCNPKLIKNFVVADACHLPFKNECFSLVYSSHVIEHVNKPELMLSEMFRVAKNKVVVRCPHRLGSGARRPFHLNYFDEGWFKKVAAWLGCSVVCFVNGFEAFVPFPVKGFDKSYFVRGFKFVQRKAGLKRPFEVEAWFSKVSNERLADGFKVVCVFNNHLVLKNCLLKSNVPFSDVALFENRQRLGLPVFFNSVIESFLDKDVWLVFCHQDFVFYDDLNARFAGLDACAVYGVIGVSAGSRVLFGRIVQTNGKSLGVKLSGLAPVQTVDEMCLIVHSSLFRSGLRFDERFSFHFYGADLCSQALEAGFNVFALQLDCQHKSRTLSGDINSDDYRFCLRLFIKKWRRFLPIRTTTKYVSKELEGAY